MAREDFLLADKAICALKDERPLLAKRQDGTFYQTRDEASLNSLKLPFSTDAHSLLRGF